jgi:pimeloyl-ACP methyl ester carboxylesterase
MRALRYVAAVVAAWFAASALGAVAALGPARGVRGEWGFVTVIASLGTVGLLGALLWLGLRVSRRRWIRVVTIAVSLPLVAIAALPVGVAVWATHPPHADYDGGIPAGAIEVSIDADDGVVLAGWYVPTENGAAVVLSHGAGSTRDDVVRHAEVLADAGYGVLAIDARGHGESTGPAMDLGWWGEADISAALDALVAMDGVDADRLGLVGISMGGEESIGAAGEDPRVKVVVAEGATQRIAADKDGWLPGGPAGLVQRRMDSERDALLTWLTDAPKPSSLREAAATSAAPLLLITAGQVPDEEAAARWIARDNARVDIWTVDGAAHTGGLATAPGEWQSRVVTFLNDAIGD